jgi:biopolymer transport protein ExbB/biopolymer transport protein TolQ
MDMNLIEIWAGMSGLVRTVVVVLTLQALGCIYVVVDRLLLLATSYRSGRKFAKLAGPLLGRGDYPGALELARKHDGSHLAGFIVVGVETFMDQRRRGSDESKAAYLTERALERHSEALNASLQRGMNILASTGSTAPFVGLLGTVLGILHAFKLVGQQGSGGMGTIGVAIAEALIVTGYGLMVAIPSVLLFNWLSARLVSYEQGLSRARRELVDRLEGNSEEERSEPGTRESPRSLAGQPIASGA